MAQECNDRALDSNASVMSGRAAGQRRFEVGEV
jgi:hypothetical protein